MEEYLRRNKLVAAAIGVRAGIDAAIKRLEQQKNPPKWLLDILHNESIKQYLVAEEMVVHRDEVKPKTDC